MNADINELRPIADMNPGPRRWDGSLLGIIMAARIVTPADEPGRKPTWTSDNYRRTNRR